MPSARLLQDLRLEANAMALYNALIRTHHITSRKKVVSLRAAAFKHSVYALLCSGGCPGIMYCQGVEDDVRAWVTVVQKLRYKDYQLVKKPAEKEVEGQDTAVLIVRYSKLEEVESVKEFGARMEQLGIRAWWRKGMGFVGDD